MNLDIINKYSDAFIRLIIKFLLFPRIQRDFFLHLVYMLDLGKAEAVKYQYQSVCRRNRPPM
ncbi:MAG: hypothetical protein ACFFFC_03265 [Candidatus Thorarchaeota archaeon]